VANLALYRKHRPRTFAEVIGQEHVTAPLIQALSNGRINHAYLFSGPRGCGKTSSARILARSLNCLQGPTPEPCGICDSCVALAPDGPGSLDVIEIDAASHGGVDDARDLRERAFFSPVSSRYKVYVIDEAHMVTSQGFNALLKLVEEPPDYVKFVFATTEPDKVLQTIRSRTHHYPFRLIPPGVMRGLLERICADEGVTIEPAVLPLVVRAGGGSARDSLSLLDQLFSGAGPDGVTYARAVGLLGVTDTALLDEACEALAAADGAGLFGVVDRVVEAGHDCRRFAADLLDRLRDLMILASVPDAAAKGLVDAPPEEAERRAGLAARLGPATASRLAEVVHAGLVEMRGTTSPRLLLELVCARALLPGADDGQAATLQRLERLERRFSIASDGVPSPAAVGRADPPAVSSSERPVTAGVAAAVPETTVPNAAEPGPADRAAAARAAQDSRAAEPVAAPDPPEPTPAPVVAAGLDATAVRQVWPQIVEHTKRRRVVWALLQNATPREVRGDELILAVKHQGEVRRLADEQIVAVLQEAVQTVLGVRWRIRAETDGPAGPAGGPAGAGRGRQNIASASVATSPPDSAPPPVSVPSQPSASDSSSAVRTAEPVPAVSDWPTIAPVGQRAAPAAPAPTTPAQSPSTNGTVPPEVRPVSPAPVARPEDVPLPPEPTGYEAMEGFDPDDEPMDGPADAAVRAAGDSGADAIALIEQHLGGRRIGS
jgi:DNA polymerase-3 subunit gamma/tau